MRCAVLGDPIDHSLSPVLHRAAYAALGLNWRYDAVRVPAGGMAEFLATLDDEWRGVSMTMPLKREVLPLVGWHRDAVRLAGGANTLVREPDGELWLDNTDLPGAAAAVRERYAGPVGTVAVLGAGATAASTALGLCDLGARTVYLHARSAERAAETVRAVSAHARTPQVEVRGLDEPVSGDVVVSTVPVEAQDGALVAATASAAVVFEVLYHPWPTPLARAAVERGQVLVSGFDLLLHQAALQVELFTGQVAPLEVMRDAGLRALQERER